MAAPDEISFHCPACLSALRTESSLAGCQTQCPFCGCGIEVPVPAPPAEPSRAPTARSAPPRRRRKVRRPRRRGLYVSPLIKPGPAVRKLPSAHNEDFALWICAIALAVSLLWLLFRNV